jgi:hypothetical protein
VRELIEDAVAQGAVPPREDIEQDARLMMYLARSVYQVLATSTDVTRPEAVVEHAWRFCLGGLLLPPPGRAKAVP